MDRIHLSTLGQLELTLNGQPALVRRRKELALLAYLARRAPRPADRASLASMLWSDSEDARARHSLSQALSDLRSVLGDDLRIDFASVRLDGSTLGVDATEFENDVRQERWTDAVARWQGPFLAGFDDLGNERWEAWLDGERTVLNAKLGLALERLVRDCEARGSWEAAIPWAERLVELQPHDVEAARRLLSLLLAAGRDVDARACLAAFDLRMSRDLDVGPNPELHQLLNRARSEPPPVRPGTRGLMSPDLVGRGDAFTVLTTAWQDLRGTGVGHVVVIEGDEGQGKSRLITEFQRAIRRRDPDTLVLGATAFVSEQQVPFAALRPLVERLAEAPGAPGAPPASLAALSRIWPEVRDRYPGLPASVVDESVGVHLEQVVATVADERPLVLVLDDAPSADPESQGAIGGLIRRPPRGVLLLLAGRTDAWNQSALARDITVSTHLERLELQPLSLDGTGSLLTSMAPFRPEVVMPLAERLHAETGGAPGRIEQLVRRMADDGLIAPGASGEWEAREASPGPLPIPLSVRETMEARLARLDPGARALAEVAAVLGPDIDLSLLETVGGLEPSVWQSALGDLISHRVIRQHDGRTGRYEFLSDANRRAVYELTAPSRRRLLHRQAMDALDRRTPDTSTRAAITAHRVLAGARSGIRRSWLIAGTATLLAAVVLLAVVIRGRRAAHVEPGTPVLLADVRNLTGDTLLDQSVYTAAVVSLQQSRRIWVFPRSRIPEVLARMGVKARDTTIDEGLAREVAQRENIRIVVLLSINRVDPSLILTSRLIEASTGRDLRAFETMVPDRAAILAGLTQLLHTTRRALGETREELAGRSDSLPAVTTASLEALKAYAEGQGAWRAADYPRARVRWERAIELDSSFALAHVTMAEWHYLMNDRVKGKEFLDRARLHAAKLTERERLALDQVSAYQLGKNPEAIAAAKTTAERYPEPATIANYAWTLFRTGNCRDAIPVYRRVLAMSSRSSSWINLATCFNNLREYDSALAAYSQAERVDSLALIRDNINHEWGSAFVRLGRPLAAESAFRRILGRSEPNQRMRGYRSLAWLAMYQGRYREAMELFQESNVLLQKTGSNSRVSVFRNQVNMVHVAISRHDSAGARSLLRGLRQLMATLSPEPGYYAWMANAYLRLEEPRRVREMLDLISKSLTPTDRQDSITYRLTAAWHEEIEGRPRGVIELLGDLDAEFREALREAHLGKAYMRLGRPDSALRLFEDAQRHSIWGFEGQEESVRLPLDIAAAALQLGDTARAAKALGEFLTLWRHADKDLPELRLAKDQLARLTGSRAR